MSRNYNTKEMKVAFFDRDEDDPNIASLSQATLTKLLSAIDYGIERTVTRNTNVKLCTLLDPDVEVSKEQMDGIMTRLREKQLTILVTTEDLVVGKTNDGKIFTLKITGGAKFVASIPAPAPDDGSTGSQFDELENMGLTQECNLESL